MPNRIPVFTDGGRFPSVLITAANVSSQGGGTVATDIFLLLTPDQVDGTFVDRVEFMPTGTVANTATAATVGRVFIGTVGAGTTTSANTRLYREVTLASVTADSSTAGNTPVSVPLGFMIAATEFILVTCHAAPAATTAWRASAIVGDL